MAQIDLHGDQHILMPGARPLEPMFGAWSGRRTSALLTSSPNAYAKAYAPGRLLESYDKEDGDMDGPFVVGGITEFWTMVSNVSTVANVICFGSSMLLDGIRFGNQSQGGVADPRFGNGQLIDSVIGHLFPEMQSVTIRPSIITSYWFTVSAGEAATVRILMCVIMPVFILASGLLVSWRRKNA
jgi:hypothetical protein